jgi:hypothetical protein
MNSSETAVTNAANLSLFMVNLTQPLLHTLRSDVPDSGILDLKAHFRGHKYVTETLKLLPEKPEPILIQRISLLSHELVPFIPINHTLLRLKLAKVL